MKVGIIGAGNMGSALARSLADARHEVFLTSDNISNVEKTARQIGPKVKAVPQQDLAKYSNVIIAATPAAETVSALESCGDISGKIVIDTTNPTDSEIIAGSQIGAVQSFAEDLAESLPNVKIVKAFNTVFAEILKEGPDFGAGNRATTYYCGDDEMAKNTVHELIESMGFEAIDAGPLANARYLEPMGMLMIWLGYAGNRGTNISFNLVTRGQMAAKKIRAA